jgi:hypothetical protein
VLLTRAEVFTVGNFSGPNVTPRRRTLSRFIIPIVRKMCDKSLVLSLVRAHLLHHPDYLSWVPSYTTIRWCKKKSYVTRVGGHYRRKALYARMLSALHATCKLQELIYPEDATRVCPPPTAFRERWNKDGEIVPMRVRQLQWS